MNVYSATKIILYKITRTETSASTLNVFFATKIILYKITRTDTSAHNFERRLRHKDHKMIIILINIYLMKI